MGRKLIFLFLLFTLAQGSVIDDKNASNICSALSVPEEELRFFKEIVERMMKHLDKALENGSYNTTKALSSPSVSNPTLLEEDPLECFLLQYLVGMGLGTEKGLSNVKDGVQKGTTIVKRPEDCSDLLVAGHTKSGVYKIYPFMCRCSRPVEVFCDMDTEGGGWTLFLQRENTSKPINFTRNWQSYKEGFGDPNQEYWLGNDNLHFLTFTRDYTLRMEVKDEKGEVTWAQWNEFRVDSEENKYKLLVSEYDPKSLYGNGGFEYVNGMNFTTFDQDNDKMGSINCGEERKSGWWHNECNYDHPTGISGLQSEEGIRVQFLGKEQKVAYVNWFQLKIRPAICNHLISVI